MFDPRNAVARETDRRGGFRIENDEAPDAARSLMHGIFVGEIQALEGAGRTCWDFETGKGSDEAPFELKLDMARQCWDEARHAEIMIKRIEATGVPWRPGDPGFAPYPLDNGPWQDIYPGGLFDRLVAMNRGIEGLSLDTHVFRSDTFAALGDDVAAATHLYIVADEAPHVGFGTRWLR